MMSPDLSERALPRELAPGLWWLGRCLHYRFEFRGRELHAYNSLYLVAGKDACVLVDGGFPGDIDAIEEQLTGLLGSLPPLKFIFTTHSETPHSGCVGRILDRFPGAIACGEVSDLHLVYPQFTDRLRPMAPGERLDIGGSELVVTEAVIRDYLHTRWAFDTKRRILFTGDGLSHSHYHAAGFCGHVTEELSGLDLPDMTALFGELAFFWTRFNDLEPYISRLDELIFDELKAQIICPAHGLPVTDPRVTMPEIRAGLRAGALATESQL